MKSLSLKRRPSDGIIVSSCLRGSQTARNGNGVKPSGCLNADKTKEELCYYVTSLDEGTAARVIHHCVVQDLQLNQPGVPPAGCKGSREDQWDLLPSYMLLLVPHTPPLTHRSCQSIQTAHSQSAANCDKQAEQKNPTQAENRQTDRLLYCSAVAQW